MKPPRFATLDSAITAAEARATTLGKPHYVFHVTETGAEWFAVSTVNEPNESAALVATCEPGWIHLEGGST